MVEIKYRIDNKIKTVKTTPLTVPLRLDTV